MHIKNQLKFVAGTVLLTSVLLFSNCKKEEVLLPSSETALNLKTENLIAASSAPSNAYNIQNALPSGFVKDGSRDYTSYIQKAIDSHSEIVFPNFPIMVNDAGLKIGSNKRITFLDGSEIRLKPTSKTGYNILSMRGVTNVTLIDPVVIGDRNGHLGTTGEAGVGIGMRGSSNITIRNPEVTNCWGDGIYIGSENGPCRNIAISGGFAKNNRRDGMSIINVVGFKLDNFYAGFNQGTAPQCGINFEPNTTANEIKGVVFNNITTEGNPGYGIQMGFTNIFGAGNKYVDITINNHVDKQSKKAIKMSAYTSRRSGNEVISVNVVYNNPSWKHHPLTPKDIIAVALFEDAQKLTIKNPSIQTASGYNLTNSEITTVLNRLFNDGSNTVLSFGSTTTAVPSTNGVVFAVNAGGKEVTFDGITYSADKNFSGGGVYSTTNSIASTSNDALYQSERFGNFSYSVPVSDGTYEVTLKMAEVFHSASGKRRFDVRFEGVERVTNLDLYAVAGRNTAYDIVKTVEVTDGTLNIQFNTDLDNAKVSAFKVVKK